MCMKYDPYSWTENRPKSHVSWRVLSSAIWNSSSCMYPRCGSSLWRFEQQFSDSYSKCRNHKIIYRWGNYPHIRRFDHLTIYQYSQYKRYYPLSSILWKFCDETFYKGSPSPRFSCFCGKLFYSHPRCVDWIYWVTKITIII